jgi:hypothetical protein
MTSTTATITRTEGRYLIDLAKLDDQREAYGYVNVPARRWIKSRNDWARSWSTITLRADELAGLGLDGAHTPDCDLIVYRDGAHTCDCAAPVHDYYTATTVRRPATELAVGDIVWADGMRIELVTENKCHTPGLVSFTGPVTNADELPKSMRVSVWTVQGNAFRTLDVEVSA